MEACKDDYVKDHSCVAIFLNSTFVTICCIQTIDTFNTDICYFHYRTVIGLGAKMKDDLEACKEHCMNDHSCVAISSQREGSDQSCLLLTAADVDMMTLESSQVTSAVGFLKDCS